MNSFSFRFLLLLLTAQFLILVVQAKLNKVCVPGRLYCGYELSSKYRVIQLQGVPPDHHLFRCRPTGDFADVVNYCKSGCFQQGHNEDSRCKCINQRKYCGHELRGHGWKGMVEEAEVVYMCLENGVNARRVQSCKGHCVVGWNSFCNGECDPESWYCGSKLNAIGWNGYDNNTLYICNEEGNNITDNGTVCASGTCQWMYRANDRCSCVPGKTYCGHQLYAMGWEITLRQYMGWINRVSNNNQYYCTSDSTIVDVGRSNECGNPCEPGRSYCGYELAKDHWYITESGRQNRYVCNPDGSLNKRVAGCTTCISDGLSAYCQCIPGWTYCGSTIYLTGWQGYGETKPFLAGFSNDTLYYCSAEGVIDQIDTCAKDSCTSTDRGDAYCKCIPGTIYCGHSLSPRYNSYYEYLYPEAIYLCAANGTHAIKKKQCKGCLASDPPRCQEKCTVNRRYCGSRLVQLEGWDSLNLNPDTLYNCTNDTSYTVVDNCHAGCEDSADSSAYCRLLPTAWYWILMAVVLPLAFIVLSSLLIRTWVKHRRLEKFIRQRRIDASQLRLGEKLGSGQFGEVWSGEFRDANGRRHQVALKVSKHHVAAGCVSRVPTSSTPRSSAIATNLGLASADCFLQEIVALEFLRHRNIIQAFGICSNFKDAEGKTAPALVLEYMNGGNAAHYVITERKHLFGRNLIQIFVDICRAGQHLCKMGVVHRDIGACNVLIRKNGSQPIIAKLNDFGLAKDIGKLSSLYKASNPDRAVFPVRYTAPEGFRGRFSSKSDVWSFGVFMWEMYTMLDETQTCTPLPYSGVADINIEQELLNGTKLQRPARAPEAMYEIMESCWYFYPDSRPSFDQLLTTLRSALDVPLPRSQSGQCQNIPNPRPMASPTMAVEFELTPHGGSSDATGRGYDSPDLGATGQPLNTASTPTELYDKTAASAPSRTEKELSSIQSACVPPSLDE